MTDRDERILTFRPRADRDDAQPPVTIKTRNPRPCTHDHIVVDEQLWRLECEDCGEILDPIRVILDTCLEWKRVEYYYQKIQEYEAREKADAEKRRKRYEAKNIDRVS